MEAQLRQQPTGLTFSLGETCVIGRSEEADVQVYSSRVSRQHAMIRWHADGYRIYDLDSANGTMVNDRDVDQPTLLQDGDIITLADILFQFHVPTEAEQVSPPAPAAPTVTFGGVQKLPIIALVSDIVNFSGISEKVTEEQLASILNVWYEDCRRLMEESKGQIDKFMGDGMFAYWRQTSPEARVQALRVARQLVCGPQDVPEGVAKLMRKKGVSIRCGVGLHIGTAAVGSVARGEKTALGEVVNIAFRIEAKTRDLGYPILASADFFENWEVGKSVFHPLGPQELRGHSEPVELYASKSGCAASGKGKPGKS
ncbi:MAG: adenylate/guanylate cyclase domain-containing protein [Verrucomicrobia bacterium]|nr:adenylate/guanylate cyclase domain-containing protein [Verrucomicrobiota bacterium]